MKESQFAVTGTLFADRVTDMIRALFGQFTLCETFPKNGMFHFGELVNSNRSWEVVLGNLQVLVNKLQLNVRDDEDDRLGTIMEALVTHFGCPDPDQLNSLIDSCNLNHQVKLSQLFEIALAIDDGHGLRSLSVQKGCNCSNTHLFEFAGTGRFLGKYFNYGTETFELHYFGQHVDSLLKDGDLDQVEILFKREVERFISGVFHPLQQVQLRNSIFGLPTPFLDVQMQSQSSFKYFIGKIHRHVCEREEIQRVCFITDGDPVVYLQDVIASYSRADSGEEDDDDRFWPGLCTEITKAFYDECVKFDAVKSVSLNNPALCL
ncbi:hypothetical protein [Flavobacterium sp.]|uniref:hypothetical protein n=1 Tax=Flavobacterium sp. TaxID=239 RepID=UPI0026385628|nr:hypothetical protein [Flavobacterium sp.]